MGVRAKPRGDRWYWMPQRYAEGNLQYSYLMLTPSAFSDDLTDFFRAGRISTAVTEAITVELTESAKVAHERLEDARFDQAPVMLEGRPVGWVATVGLTHARSVKSVVHVHGSGVWGNRY
jgi:hypothetical protein